MTGSRHVGLWLTLLLVATGILYFYRIGDVPLTDGDSALYGYIARDLVRTGDWQSMRWRGGPFLDKPPLSMWGMALGYVFFGFNEFASRAWQSVLSVLTVLVTFAIGRLYYSDRAGLIGAAALGTCVQFLYQQFVPQQDVPLTLALAAGFYLVGLSLRTGRNGYYYLAWAAFGLAVLSKGLVGIAIAAFVLVGVMLLEWRTEQRPIAQIAARWVSRTLVGLVALMAVAGPWFVAEGMRHGYPFFDLLFFRGNERFITRLEDIPKGPIYLAYLLVGFLPWSGLLWHALRRTWDGAFRGHEGDRLLLAWFAGVLFLFGVLMGWKVMRYIFPLYPAGAVMLGRYMDELLTDLERGRREQAVRVLHQATAILGVVIVPLLAVGFLALTRRFPQETRPYLDLLLPYLAGLGLTLAVVAATFWLGRLREGLAAGLFLSAVSYLMLVNSVAAGWDSVSPWRVMAQTVAQYRSGGVPILFEPSMPAHGNVFVDYYVEPRPELAWTDEDLERLWAAKGTPLILAPKRELDRFLAEHPGFQVQELRRAAAGWVVAQGKPRRVEGASGSAGEK